MIVKEENNGINKLPLYTILGLLTGLILTLINFKTIITLGVVIYAVSCLGVILNGFKQKNRIRSVVITYTGLIALLSIISMLFGFPYATELHILMILPILGFVYLIFRNKLTRLEYGFLIILNIDLLIRNIQFFT